MSPKKTKVIEEYHAARHFLFTHLKGESHVSLIGTSYTKQMIMELTELAIETFGDNMTYTLVEK